MSDTLTSLYKSLNSGPAVLFMGQKYLSLEGGRDPLLLEIVRKYGPADGQASGYSDIFRGELHALRNDGLAWAQNRCTRFSLPDWLRVVGRHAWNSVYTSAIDTIWQGAFRNGWRELQPIFEESYNPSNPRNQLLLHCTYLFGRVDRIERDEQPPLTMREYNVRRQTALALLRRLPEIVTPFGVLVVDGYDSGEDWLPLPDLLSAVVDALDIGQCHVFDADQKLRSDPYAAELIAEGKLTIHERGLAHFLTRGQDEGLVGLGQRIEQEAGGRRMQVRDTSFVVPAAIWNQTTRSATIMDDAIIAPPKPVSREETYRLFRNFLSESGTMPLWSGYGRGFAFRRDFEEDLCDAVSELLNSRTLVEDPVILSGQTGTGKTVALGSLAYTMRRQGLCPVLFIESNRKRPNNSDIDLFCQWFKDEWASRVDTLPPSMLIVWDANDTESYFPLARYLAGRGLRAVVVGSCYRVERARGSTINRHKIVVPSSLSDAEIGRLTKFLNQVEPTLGEQLKRHVQMGDNSFLVALYRLLPATRFLIRSGVIREYDKTEKDIERLSRLRVDEDEQLAMYGTTLFHALVKAGVLDETDMLSSAPTPFAGEQVTEVHKLLGLVMMPGSFGLRLPFELLLRVLKKGETSFFSTVLGQFDIFRWYQDPIGNITIGPRHSLEAKLWTRANLGGAKFEIEYARELLSAIRDTGEMFDNVEVQFAVDLLKHIGPNNRDAEARYDPFCKELADTLGKLRTKRSVLNPRLMLQEASLLREYVRIESRSHGLSPSEADHALALAEEVLNEGLGLMGPQSQMRSVYLGELASILGTRLEQNLSEGGDVLEAFQLFQRTRDIALRAWATDPENYIPIDILSWTTRDLLQADGLASNHRVEAEATILHAFDLAESEEFSPDQAVTFQRRRLEIGQLLGAATISDDAFESLKALGSAAGFYLNAQRIAGTLPSDSTLTPEQLERSKGALSYLQKNLEYVQGDGRTLYLILKLWWMATTGKPMFYQERQTVPFSAAQWEYLAGLLEALMSLDEVYSSPRLMFILGLAKFHLGDVRAALAIFRELQRGADYGMGRRRIIRSYVGSTPEGRPQVFSGEVRWVADDGRRGGVYVPELREVIDFFPRDFGVPNIRRGDSLGEFHIAFNFLGVVADPLSYIRGT